MHNRSAQCCVVVRAGLRWCVARCVHATDSVCKRSLTAACCVNGRTIPCTKGRPDPKRPLVSSDDRTYSMTNRFVNCCSPTLARTKYSPGAMPPRSMVVIASGSTLAEVRS